MKFHTILYIIDSNVIVNNRTYKQESGLLAATEEVLKVIKTINIKQYDITNMNAKHISEKDLPNVGVYAMTQIMINRNQLIKFLESLKSIFKPQKALQDFENKPYQEWEKQIKKYEYINIEINNPNKIQNPIKDNIFYMVIYGDLGLEIRKILKKDQI